jgi:hypothetical protein
MIHLDKIIKQLNKLKDVDIYEDILRKTIEHCENELAHNNTNKCNKIIQKRLLKSPFKNQEFKSMFKDIHVTTKDLMRIGNIQFSRRYANGEKTKYEYDVCASNILATIDSDDLQNLTCFTVGYDLVSTYEKQNFITITQDNFLKYVGYVLTKIMDIPLCD